MNRLLLRLDQMQAKEKNKKEHQELMNEKLHRELLKDEKKAKIWALNTPPKRSILEEVGNSITHGVGALVGVFLLVLMLLKANITYEYVAASIYGGCLIVMMLSSCLYHAFSCDSKVKRIFRRFDYSSIYLLIGGTFTPLFLVDMGGTTGLVYAILQWSLIAVGITIVGVFGPGRFSWIHFTLYFIIGWGGGIIFIGDWFNNNLPLLLWILAGGVGYTLGMIPFALKNLKAAHFIWHFFVIFGAVIQWIGIYLYVF